ncbi:MAG: redoxin domain-containing protein [Elusimicrobia bacterium]|nr:redoxin domain-containing protein [Elusimicrobiota bacterium]
MNWKASLFLTPILALSIAPCAHAAAGTPNPYEGGSAPAFILPGIDGRPVDLKNFHEGKAVWLNLFATWCPDCREEMPALVEASRNHSEVRFLDVALAEGKAETVEFVRAHVVPYPVAYDQDDTISGPYEIRPIPVNIGVRPDGTIAFRTHAVTPADIPRLIGLLTGKAGEARQPPARTPSKAIFRLFGTFPLAAAFLAGVLTFLSPCVLPMIPIYLAILGHPFPSPADGTPGGARIKLFASALMFVIGFGLVFTMLGATATALGRLLSAHAWLLRVAGGVFVAVMGLHLAGVFRILPLYRELRWRPSSGLGGPAGAFVMGMAFAAGWAPCVGPILSSILLYSAASATVAKGAALLAVYSLGLGAPFLAASLSLPGLKHFSELLRPHHHAMEIASGAFLVGLGGLLITDKLAVLSRIFAYPW